MCAFFDLVQLQSCIIQCQSSGRFLCTNQYLKANQCCRVSNCAGEASALVTLVRNRLKSSTSTSSESCVRCRSSRSTRNSSSSLFKAANNHPEYRGITDWHRTALTKWWKRSLSCKKLHCMRPPHKHIISTIIKASTVVSHYFKIKQEVKVIWQTAPQHSPVRGHPRGSKVVPLNSWGRVSY